MLLHSDSFDTATTVARLAERYASHSISSITTGRTGINCVYYNWVGTFLTTRALPASGSTAVVGFALKIGAFGNGGSLVLVYEGATLHVYCAVSATGYVVVKRGDGTTLATSSVPLTANTWCYFEFKTTIHDSTGTYEVRVDESTFGGLAATGQDTRNGGTGVWDTVALGGVSTNGNTFIDDFYVCDGSGSVNNGFLGNVKITAVLPQTDGVGGAGGNQDFTCSTGSDHGALVDESDPNGDTDYVSSSTTGHRDTFNFPACGVTGTIKAVVTVPYLKKTDAGVRTATAVVRISATNYDNAGSVAPTTSYAYWPQVWETNPATSAAWTAGGVDGAEFGLKIVT